MALPRSSSSKSSSRRRQKAAASRSILKPESACKRQQKAHSRARVKTNAIVYLCICVFVYLCMHWDLAGFRALDRGAIHIYIHVNYKLEAASFYGCFGVRLQRDAFTLRRAALLLAAMRAASQANRTHILSQKLLRKGTRFQQQPTTTTQKTTLSCCTSHQFSSFRFAIAADTITLLHLRKKENKKKSCERVALLIQIRKQSVC